MLVRLWRTTGYLLWDWCIFTEILKWTCTKQWKCSYLPRQEGHIFDNFKIFLSIKVIKIALDSMLYETLKWPQIAPFCISSKMIMACTLLSLIYAPENMIDTAHIVRSAILTYFVTYSFGIQMEQIWGKCGKSRTYILIE